MPQASTIFQHDYTCDDAGNRTLKIYDENDETTYTYNTLNALTQTSGTRGNKIDVTGTVTEANMDYVKVTPKPPNESKEKTASLKGPFCVRGPSLIIAVCASFALAGCGPRAASRDPIRRFKTFFREAMPGDAESEAEWKKLAQDIASMGSEVVPVLVKLARVSSTGREFAHVSRTYFFEPIWLLPKDELRQAGLLLVEMPEDYLPDQYARINGLRALAMVHEKEDLGIILQSLRSQYSGVREFATYCLGFWPADMVFDQIAISMRSKDPDIRFEACVAAFNTGAKEFTEHFRRLAREEEFSDFERVIALEALGNWGDVEAVPQLVQMATQGESIAGAWAVRALTRMGAYENWEQLAEALDKAGDGLLIVTILDYLLRAPDDKARELARSRIAADETLGAEIEDWANWPFEKRPRDRGGGYVLNRHVDFL